MIIKDVTPLTTIAVEFSITEFKLLAEALSIFNTDMYEAVNTKMKAHNFDMSTLEVVSLLHSMKFSIKELTDGYRKSGARAFPQQENDQVN